MGAVTDRQVKRLFRLLSSGMPLSLAALKAGMDVKTARRYRRLNKLPKDVAPSHDWRTREDPFASVWPEVHEQLTLNARLRAKTLFQWLQRRYPGRFQDGQLRTFQRGVKRWRALSGPAKEVFFSQVHRPGELGASDFTHMSSLGVTIQGQPFEHMVYHFVLTYSNWEDATICFSESFESLSLGLQNALWKLGGSPLRHRTDRMSLAVNNLSDEKEFTHRYQGLMDHYGLAMEKTQAGKGNENGDVEASHRWFKDVVDQALMLRGSRDFCSREEYRRFLQELLDQQNAGREQRLAEERSVLQPLPDARRESYKQLEVTVNSGSLIRVAHNTYSVHSRLIGERVQVRLHADHLEVRYAQREVERHPRLRGSGKSQINYRHVIDWLIRKPGAFESYRYRDSLFPTSRFRIAYDLLQDTQPRSAAKEYLQILQLAAKESETAVDDALRVLLNEDEPFDCQAVKALVCREEELPAATTVHVETHGFGKFRRPFQ